MSPTVLITGASSGIGKASAALFADRGWNVIATMRNQDDGECVSVMTTAKQQQQQQLKKRWGA